MVIFEALFCSVAALHCITSDRCTCSSVNPPSYSVFMTTSLLLLPSLGLIIRLIFKDAETEKVVEEKQFFPFFSSFSIAVVSSLLPLHFRIRGETHKEDKRYRRRASDKTRLERPGRYNMNKLDVQMKIDNAKQEKRGDSKCRSRSPPSPL